MGSSPDRNRFWPSTWCDIAEGIQAAFTKDAVSLPYLDRTRQLSLGIGDTLNLEQVKQNPRLFRYWPFDDAIDDEEKKILVVLTGGDAFIVHNETGRIYFVVRNFMNTMDSAELVRASKTLVFGGTDEQWNHYNPKSSVDATGELRADSFAAETPGSIPGGKTVTPLQAFRAILGGVKNPEQKPVVLAAIGDDLGPPTAHKLPDVASSGGSDDDSSQATLAQAMKSIAPNKTTPLVVYSDSSSSWLSYNAAPRLIHLGYTDVRWMKPECWDGRTSCCHSARSASRPDSSRRAHSGRVAPMRFCEPLIVLHARR